MNYPWGLYLAQKYFRKLGWKKKRMTACFLEAGKIVLAENSWKTTPKSTARGNRIHCEAAVLKGIDKGTNGVVYIYRETKSGETGYSRPCDACFTLIRAKGIKKIVYATETGYAVERIR